MLNAEKGPEAADILRMLLPEQKRGCKAIPQMQTRGKKQYSCSKGPFAGQSELTEHRSEKQTGEMGQTAGWLDPAESASRGRKEERGRRRGRGERQPGSPGSPERNRSIQKHA